MIRSVLALLVVCMMATTSLAAKGKGKGKSKGKGKVAAKAKTKGDSGIKASLVGMYDKDADGELDGKERLPLLLGLRHPDAGLLGLLDTDGDGKLSVSEQAEARSALASAPPQVTRKNTGKGRQGKGNKRRR